MESFCRREFVDKVKGLGEADAFPSDDAEARWIWPEFAGPSGFRLAANRFVRWRRTMETHRPRHLPRGLSRHP
ncbi:hypothetical protein FHS21_005844 [Phyllobacterium trifolii]|uniref:Uncharacterized protein n=1 Tax=Phyllobacterium trifolii TaxID=300193 RepID=A0A839UL92_9HYPH|nr:hypothetical protein [Phyllobacterium trifolii]